MKCVSFCTVSQFSEGFTFVRAVLTKTVFLRCKTVFVLVISAYYSVSENVMKA